MNQENNNEEQPQEGVLDRLTQKDILGLTLDIIPSILYVRLTKLTYRYQQSFLL